MSVCRPGDIRLVRVKLRAATTCQECQWAAPRPEGSYAAARRHVAATGHIVVTDRIERTVYSPRRTVNAS